MGISSKSIKQHKRHY